MATSGTHVPQPNIAAAVELLRQHKGLFQALAISWMVLGVLSILAPVAAGVAVTLIVAWFLLLGGRRSSPTPSACVPGPAPCGTWCGR